jgi:excisionase family DNA binding protein
MLPHMTQLPERLTATEMARRHGVHPETIRRWAREGRISYLRSPSGRISFPADQEILQAVPAQGQTA